MEKKHFIKNLKTLLLDKTLNSVKFILTCVHGMGIENVLSMSFVELIVQLSILQNCIVIDAFLHLLSIDY
jgi:hypothetical protein